VEFIDDDELVEVTPSSIRLRKKLLTESERRAPRARPTPRHLADTVRRHGWGWLQHSGTLTASPPCEVSL
ncbi:MAG: hypothetical protein B6D42_06980, partial [Anaerolineae bacterium UTCFX5]